LKDNSCSCTACTIACYKKPGHFRPIQVFDFLESKKMKLSEALQTGLLQYEIGFHGPLDDAVPFLVISPATKHKSKYGVFYDYSRLDPCVFLQKGKCGLHDTGLKPYECKAFHHSMMYDKSLNEEHQKNLSQSINQWAALWEMVEKDPKAKNMLQAVGFDFIPDLSESPALVAGYFKHTVADFEAVTGRKLKRSDDKGL
jgi:Fe-S-cluster containining protein